MAIRTVKIDSLLTYEQRKAFEAEHKGAALTPYLYVQGFKPWEGISISTADHNPQHALYFYASSDEIKYEGCVVRLFSKEERIMSDVWAYVDYAIVWDATEEKFLTIVTGNSEFSGGFQAAVKKIDATSEVFEYYEAYLCGIQFRTAEGHNDSAYARELEIRRTITKGKTVRVNRGRKVPQGTQGVVFWMKDDRWGTRLGIATSDRKNDRGYHADVTWVAASNCDVINPNTGRVV